MHKSQLMEPKRRRERPIRVLDDYLRDHDGVITRAQARSAGISDDSISRRVRSGHWRRCAPGVFFVDDRPFTDAARVRSAVWSYGPAATASGLAAAWWHGVTRYPPDCVEVTVPKVSNHRKRDGIRVRRRDLLSDDIVERNGLRVTALPLSVIQAATRRRGGATLTERLAAPAFCVSFVHDLPRQAQKIVHKSLDRMAYRSRCGSPECLWLSTAPWPRLTVWKTLLPVCLLPSMKPAPAPRCSGRENRRSWPRCAPCSSTSACVSPPISSPTPDTTTNSAAWPCRKPPSI